MAVLGSGGRSNEVILHRARLALGWITVSGVQLLVSEIYLDM